MTPLQQLFLQKVFTPQQQVSCLSTIASLNPIDVRLLPNMVSYIEILADNQIVGAINIPTTMH